MTHLWAIISARRELSSPPPEAGGLNKSEGHPVPSQSAKDAPPAEHIRIHGPWL